jgi:osmoprotectant transport system substrate-binding protein
MPRLRSTTRLALAVTGGVTAIALAGCSAGGSSDLAGGSLADDYDLSGVELTVGSDSYTEQLVLGQIALLALEGAGADVEDQIGLTGTSTVRAALESSDIDLYWEYTGTAWISFLGETTPVVGSTEQYDAVVEADAANDITWFGATPFNNTYQLAYSAENNPDLDVSTISDVADLINGGDDDLTICVGPEFDVRDDGLPGMEAAYGFEFPADNVVVLDDGVIYNEIAENDTCTFGVVFSTDGRIQALDLSTLEDDEQFFPSYNAAVTTRTEVAEANPDLEALFTDIASKLTDEQMQALNAQVDVDGDSPEQVAEDWLRAEGYIG